MSIPEPDGSRPDLRSVAEPSAGSFLARRKWLLAAIALVIVLAAWIGLRSGSDTKAPRYRTEAASTGTLVVKVSATGNLQPTNQVDVGSELSGIVEKVYVDENDHVRKGQVLAELDLSKLKDAVERSRAALAAAQAQSLQAEATVAEKRAALVRLQRVSEQSGGTFISQSDLDTAEANAKRADADLASARAGVAQARAALRSDETNLAKAAIRSPIDGIVLTRKVEPGQTVAASFQAPVLFTLAEDLAKMELHVDIDEADVGQVQVGQPATFTVDAWHGRTYDAVITRVGYGSQEKEGVISYLAVLDVKNDDLSLRPGMTGTAEITTATREHALLVPNAALRFSPPSTDASTPKKRNSVIGALMPRPPQTPRKVRSSSSEAQPRVWVLDAGVPKPIEVRTGVTNGKYTEITSGELKDGTEVITEAVTTAP
jgi:HlyD family secretion protein